MSKRKPNNLPPELIPGTPGSEVGVINYGPGSSAREGPVNPEQPRTLPAEQDARPMAPVPAVRCNWDLSTLAGKTLAVRAMNPATLDVATLGTVKIMATHWCTFPDSSVDEETGEESTFTRTVLLGKNGQSVRTTSDHIARKIESIFGLFTPEEQAQGLPLVITVRPSRRPGHHYHAIELYDPNIEEGG